MIYYEISLTVNKTSLKKFNLVYKILQNNNLKKSFSASYELCLSMCIDISIFDKFYFAFQNQI